MYRFFSIQNIPIGRIFSLTEYWNVLTCDMNEYISVGTTSMKYCADVELSFKIFSSPSKGCTIPDVASPKLNRLIRCEKFNGTSSKRLLIWMCPLAKWILLPAVIWKLPATLFSVNDPWTRHASNGLLGFIVRSGKLYAVLWPPLYNISLKISFYKIEQRSDYDHDFTVSISKIYFWVGFRSYVQWVVFFSKICI